MVNYPPNLSKGLKMKTTKGEKVKKCKHEWHFVEKVTYVDGKWYKFVCVKCGDGIRILDTNYPVGVKYEVKPEIGPA